MDIGIITVYNAENCGTFLQAYALGKFLEKNGHKVSYLKRDIKTEIKRDISIFSKKIAKLHFREAWFVLKKHRAFAKSRRYFNEIDISQKDCIDCFVIGSDTVWNFNTPYFTKYKKRYLGYGLGDKRVVSYAASISNTTHEYILNDEVICNGFENFSALAVRDKSTKQIVEQITGKEAVITLDPTFLLDAEEYKTIESDQKHKDFILLYYFDKVKSDEKEALLRLREKTGKKIVSFCAYRPWADINVTLDPFNFLYYFRNADMVVTNTFHGTVFSIIHKKPFAEFGGDLMKIAELLQMLDLREQICENAEDMEKVLNQEIDYDKVEKKLDVLREQSKDYLFNALKG